MAITVNFGGGSNGSGSITIGNNSGTPTNFNSGNNGDIRIPDKLSGRVSKAQLRDKLNQVIDTLHAIERSGGFGNVGNPGGNFNNGGINAHPLYVRGFNDGRSYQQYVNQRWGGNNNYGSPISWNGGDDYGGDYGYDPYAYGNTNLSNGSPSPISINFGSSSSSSPTRYLPSPVSNPNFGGGGASQTGFNNTITINLSGTSST